MSLREILDLAGLIALVLGALLCVVAAIGLLRFPDLLTRMHAGTKPQVLGVLLVVLGVGLRVRSGTDIGMLAVVALFQLLTIPAGAHLVSRAALRTGLVDDADIHVGPREHSDDCHQPPRLESDSSEDRIDRR